MLDALMNPVIESFHAHSLAFFICAIASVVLVGISKSGFGAGLGVLSLPLMASQVGLNEALAILLPLLIAIDLVGIRRFLKNANWRILKLILPAGFLGLLLGMIFFYHHHTQSFNAVCRYLYYAVFNSDAGDFSFRFERG
ncbi:TSUP family transporter [Polynucleobacter campilacus]|uniref:TSUP family transporter n=1 Tax=Polynucleobacter campilacus TaxID=1743163 RepID=UPI003B838C29